MSASDAPVRVPGTRARSGNAMGRTRTALLAAAAACIERYGVRRTTMVDIASRSGVAKATLYNHFRTKDDLLRALVETAVADLVAASLRSSATDGPVAALTAAATALSSSAALRTVATQEPGLLAPLLTLGEGRGWQVARDGAAAVLTGGQLRAMPGDVELVLRWLTSHVGAPATREHAEYGAERLVQGLGRPSAGPAVDGSAFAAGPVLPGSVPQGAAPAGAAGVGWPG